MQCSNACIVYLIFNVYVFAYPTVLTSIVASMVIFQSLSYSTWCSNGTICLASSGVPLHNTLRAIMSNSPPEKNKYEISHSQNKELMHMC